MTEIEQELVLFFKLYLLAHKNNYINYMENARVLAQWFDFSKAKAIEIGPCSIYCGSCYNYLGETKGGAITMSCNVCQDGHNWAYEISKLAEITGLQWYLCIYLLCRAIEALYKENNVIVFQSVL